ncbi:hypothetical protein TNCV_1401011 [Trichonephila clavipes]|nr:hypothetical protein TNCV_1401011 [Trichonephila clavipes]
MTRRRIENRGRSLGCPGFVTPVFTKESKPLGKKEKITRAPRDGNSRTHLKKVSLLRGFESATFRAQVRDHNHYATAVMKRI